VAREVDTGVETFWVRVDGLRIRCLTAGARGAPPTLLLHGGGFDAAAFSYRHTIGPLSRHRRVFAPDLPGYGESEKPDLRYDLAYYARFVERLLDALGLDCAALVGVSMGGGAALSFALHSPERVEKLVLVASYGLGKEIPYGRLGYFLTHAPLSADLLYTLLRQSRRVLRWGLLSAVHNPGVVSDELVEEARQLLNQPGSGRAFRAFRKNEVGWSGLRTDLSDRLYKLAVPTLLIHGERDRVVPIEWARRAHERLPDSELRILKECGHWSPRECPGEFNRVVADFLAR